MTKEELVEELASLVFNKIAPDFNDAVAMAEADAKYNEAVVEYEKMSVSALRKLYRDEFG